MGEVSEDIVDDQESLGRIGRAGNVLKLLVSGALDNEEEDLTGLQATNGLIFPLGFIAFGDNWGDAAACSAMTVLCHVVGIEASVA